MTAQAKFYYLHNHLRSCLNELRSHALRSMLTTLGIVIAVAGVISIVAITEGMNHSLVKNFSQLGTETMMVRQNIFKAMNNDVLQPMTEREWFALQNLQTGISAVAAFSRVELPGTGVSGVRISYAGRSQIGRLLATSANLPQMTGRYPIDGRYFADSDSDARRRVCLVSEELAATLNLQLGANKPLLQIGNFQLQVIGIMPGGNRDILGTSADVYLPLGFAMQLNPKDIALEFGFRSLDESNTEHIKRQVNQLLRQIQGTRPNETANFVIENATELKQFQTDTLGTIRTVLLLVIAISLIVGCIGIMNVMLASVSERTREIGLLRAIGASQSYIQSLVLTEAAILTTVGALAGILLGLGIATIIAAGIPQIEQVILPPAAVVLTVCCAILVGIACGALPARKAALLSPITALNLE
ncbi:MAG: ABC transporter permease [Gammaproteobacteria bacterium]|nr:ABC transporter permease [Gammaproteobacteria bacterium]MBU2428698.1 ABC transporter permease [Gammaproteobacteria bacterium]